MEQSAVQEFCFCINQCGRTKKKKINQVRTNTFLILKHLEVSSDALNSKICPAETSEPSDLGVWVTSGVFLT